jgi:hypothetical protein
MDAAIAAVLGAGLGASATLVGSFVTARSAAGREAVSWERERKQAAYSNAIRALLRVRNRRSRMAAWGEPLIAKEELGTFFDDLVDAQHWLSMLLSACGERQRTTLGDASASLNSLVDEMLTAPPAGPRLHVVSEQLHEIWTTVVTAARDDIGR